MMRGRKPASAWNTWRTAITRERPVDDARSEARVGAEHAAHRHHPEEARR